MKEWEWEYFFRYISTWFNYEWMNPWSGPCVSNCGLMSSLIILSNGRGGKGGINFPELHNTAQPSIFMDFAFCVQNLKWLSPPFVTVWSVNSSCKGSRQGLVQQDVSFVNEDAALPRAMSFVLGSAGSIGFNWWGFNWWAALWLFLELLS